MKFMDLAYEIYLEALRDKVNPITFSVAKFLYALTFSIASIKEKISVIEIGTGYGFSTLWIAKAIKDAGTKGTIITIESARKRAERAIINLEKAGLKDI